MEALMALCPVCQNEIVLENDAKAFLAISNLTPWFLSHKELLEAVIKGEFRDSHSPRTHIHWACDACIQTGKAILADPTQQTFVDCVPYYAYFSLSFEACRTCGKPFQFSASEQQYWYETRKFWVQSMPKDCVDCRRERRKARAPRV
jgi:hypothetical protein